MAAPLGGELEGGSGFAGAVFQEACAIGFQGEGDGKVVVVVEEKESFSVFVPVFLSSPSPLFRLKIDLPRTDPIQQFSVMADCQ